MGLLIICSLSQSWPPWKGQDNNIAQSQILHSFVKRESYYDDKIL